MCLFFEGANLVNLPKKSRLSFSIYRRKNRPNRPLITKIHKINGLEGGHFNVNTLVLLFFSRFLYVCTNLLHLICKTKANEDEFNRMNCAATVFVSFQSSQN